MTHANRVKVLLFGRVGAAHERFKKFAEQFDIVQDADSTRDQFIEDLKKGKYDGVVGVFSTYSSEIRVGNVDKTLIQYFPSSLKYYSHLGAGYDRVDAKALLEKGIQMSNTPGPVSEATATTAIYLLLGAIRNFNYLASELRKGNWKYNPGFQAHDPKGKVFGILGMGNIGASIRDKAVPFHFSKIVYHNRHQLPKEEEGIAEYVAEFDDFLALVDIVAVSVPLNPSTHHLLNKEALSKLKRGAVIVNTARGAIIDEEALVNALESGQVSTVGLDVFEFEPKIHPKLLENPNVLLLPHAGTNTIETHIEMEERVFDNIEAGITKGTVLDLVSEQKGKW